MKPRFTPDDMERRIQKYLQSRFVQLLAAFVLPIAIHACTCIPWWFIAGAAFILLSLKTLAIAGAIFWIPRRHAIFLSYAASFSDGLDVKYGQCRKCQRLFALRNAGDDVLPFGLMDHRLVKIIHELQEHPDNRMKFWLGVVADWLYALCFRLTALIWLASGILLASACVVDDAWLAFVRLPLGAIVAIAPVLMATEIVVGLTVMRVQYPAILHGRQLADRMNAVLHQLISLADLLAAYIVGLAAVCMVWYFTVDKAFVFNGDPNGHSEPLSIAQIFPLYIDFVYFVSTTVLTIGYGDIHPQATGCRLLIMTLYAFVALSVIVLVQLALGLGESDSAARKNESCDASAAKSAADDDDKENCRWPSKIKQVLLFGVLLVYGSAAVCFSYAHARPSYGWPAKTPQKESDRPV